MSNNFSNSDPSDPSNPSDMDKPSTSRSDCNVNDSSSSIDDEAQQNLEPETKEFIVEKVVEEMLKPVTPRTPRPSYSQRRSTEPTVPIDHYGPVPGVPVGSCWKFRAQVSSAGVHRPLIAGIHGRENIGAYSIVLSGEYEEDEDHGDYFFYSGCGGKKQDKTRRMGPQVFDQKLTRLNLSLAQCCKVDEIDRENGGKAPEDKWREGKPVRVVRKYSRTSVYAPNEGFRYDGIYKVVEYFPTMSKKNLRVWKYKLRRDDENPAPWTPEGKKIINDLNLKMILPDDYSEPPERREDAKENSTPTIPRKVSRKRRTNTGENLRKSPRLSSQAISLYLNDELPLDPRSSDDSSPSFSMEEDSTGRTDLKPNLQNLRHAAHAELPPSETSIQQYVDYDVKPNAAELMQAQQNAENFEEESYADESDNMEIEDVKPDIEELNRMMSIDYGVQVKEEPTQLPVISSAMSLAAPMETEMSSSPTSSENLSAGSPSSNLSQLSKRSEHNWQIPEELLIRVSEDKLNLENWNYVTRLSYRSKEEFFKRVQVIFSCHLCASFGIHPVTLKCKHIVCQSCLETTKPDICQMCAKNSPANFREFCFDAKLRDILEDLFRELGK